MRQVKAAGGLFVIGTERHESRRIDNQLRGRSGRQGDPGRSHFFLSLEDDLMRIFGSDRMGGMLQRLGLKDGEAIVHPWINKALEKAQKKVEARNFDTRKNVLKYDDVMNAQRKEVYAQRKEFMKATDVSETVADMRAEMIEQMVLRRVPEKAFAEQWELKELADDLRRVLNLDLPIEEWGREEGIDESHLRERIEQAADAMMAAKAANMGPDLMRFIEKSLLIQTLDAVWKEHLYALDHLRQGIGLRAYGQRDPLNEYKSEAFALFNAMLDELKERVTSMLARVETRARAGAPAAADADDGAASAARRRPLPASRRWRWRALAPMAIGSDAADAVATQSIRTIPRPGATRRATRRARADRARSTSTATGGLADTGVRRGANPTPIEARRQGRGEPLIAFVVAAAGCASDRRCRQRRSAARARSEPRLSAGSSRNHTACGRHSRALP